MNRKIISVVLSAVMLFGTISFAGCQDNTAGLQAQIDELQAKLEEKTETIEELQGQVESQAGKIEQLETTKADLDEEISTLKEENEVLLERMKELHYANISKEFDLTEEKIYWEGNIEESFVDNEVYVIMKKTNTYPELQISDFYIDNLESLHYYLLKPDPNRLWNEEYIEGFRQMLVIYLKEPGKERVVEVIKELEKLDFVQIVNPNYIYDMDPGVEESAKTKSERIIEDFKITIEVDKAEVNVGELITVNVTLENLGEEDIQMVIPDFIAQKGGKEIEDIVEVQMLPDLPDFDVWWHELVLYHNKPQVTLAKKTSIQKQVQFTAEEKGDFKVHAGAFFYFQDNLEDLQEIIGDAIKIVVREA